MSALVCLLSAAYAAAWETEAQAAQQVRHLLSSPSEHFSSGILSTIYSHSHPDASLHNSPLSGPEYFAPCQSNGDLTFLALPVSQNWRNALAPGANVTFSVGSNPDPRIVDWRHAKKGDASKWEEGRPEWRKGMPSKLRVTLFGHVVELPQEETQARASLTHRLAKCFTSVHTDSVKWAPGAKESPHEARWVQLVVDRIYAVGGFGDEHRIGWVSKEAYVAAGISSKVPAEPGLTVAVDQKDAPDRHTLFSDTQGAVFSVPELPLSLFGRPSQRYFD
ncbi:hypothetical protein BCV69DRAFT_297224 [Microstroma glucosiphilum]|uniref:CREG-like beta-barrel domain-containing protein n=1 Tax=Pseudomicrostroma glucosiphilum TaxID=1684307 RepID=A0A316UFY0_9BASI|nr:hypothetical protein BCV69DRAFT_297224 [Pseudomicrostroma glucosiphilum]PWN23281.1 hypothetical protein BCV69DRAFT_297224 [Pseudomicrostroma glucosiphilum]